MQSICVSFVRIPPKNGHSNSEIKHVELGLNAEKNKKL